MDPDTRDNLALLVMFLIGIAMMLLGFGGEVLGWWNDLGVALGVGGLAVTVVTGGFGVFKGASKREVRAVGAAVKDVRDAVRGVGEVVRHVGDDVRQVGDDVRQVGEGVRNVEAAVRDGDARLDARLDQMQHSMREQTALLAQIRDRL